MINLYFSDFAENLFMKGVSWPLIISFLAFSGSLAAECTNNGRSILVRRICDWSTLFIVMRLKQWLTDNGGWVSSCVVFWFHLISYRGKLFAGHMCTNILHGTNTSPNATTIFRVVLCVTNLFEKYQIMWLIWQRRDVQNRTSHLSYFVFQCLSFLGWFTAIS